MVLALVPATRARAAFMGQLNIDFGELSPTFNGPPSTTYSGAAVIGSAGDIWNGPEIPFAFTGHRNGAGIALLDSAGAATGVALAYTVTGAYNIAAGAGPFHSSPLLPLMGDSWYNRNDTGQPGTITLSGLTAGGAYDLYLYSASDEANGLESTDFTVNALTKTAANSGAGALIAGDTYVKFSAVADASGDLLISFKSTSPTALDGLINGLQLVSAPTSGGGGVPLPSGALAGLLGIGIAGLVASRSRRGAASA
jgi:hypothetical protein